MEGKHRKDDAWWNPLIKYILIAAAIYGGARVTIDNLSADMRDYKTKTDKLCMQVNTLETRYDTDIGYIKQSLDEIKKSVRGER